MRRKTGIHAGLHWFILVFCHIVLCSHSLRHHHGHAATAILSAEESTMGGLSSSSSASSLIAAAGAASTSNVNNGPEESQHHQLQQSKQALENDDDADESDLLLESSQLIMGSPSSSVLLEQEEKPQEHSPKGQKLLTLHHSSNSNSRRGDGDVVDDDVDDMDEESVLRSPPSLINEDRSTRLAASLNSDISSSSSSIIINRVASSSGNGGGGGGSISSSNSNISKKQKQSMTDEEDEEDMLMNDEAAAAAAAAAEVNERLIPLFQQDSPLSSPLVASAPVLIHKIKVKPGHELKLKCDLNNTYGRILWLLNGNPIRTDNGRYSIQGPSSRDRSLEGRLTINNVLPEDNGVWQCHETKFDGKEHISKPIWVIVLAAPRAVHLEFDGRRVTPSTTPVAPSASSTKVTYREKDNVSIQCVVEGGNPPPKVYWYVGNMNMTNNSQIRSEYLEDDKIYITRSSLLIGNISRTDHNKSIVCIVDHELLNQQMVADMSGSARGSIDAGNSNNNMLQDSAPMSMPLSSNLLRAMARFNVEYAPSFVISRIPGFGNPVREGIFAALKCDVDANPPSRPVWMKDGGDPPVAQSEDGFLNFTRVNRNHTGWYKCMSHHPLGKFSSVGYYLSVRFDPSIVHQPPPRVEASLGGKAHIRCSADGRPSPELCWSRIGYGGSLTKVGSGQDLIVENILYQEAGNYWCDAKNQAGLEEKRAQTRKVLVTVTGRPVVYPTNRTIMGFTGQRLSLSVEMCANPPPERAFWIFGNVALRPGSRHRNKYVAHELSNTDNATACYLAELTIINVSEDDAGEYIFFVKNAKGIHEGTVVLNITQASYSVSVSTSRAYGDSHQVPASSASSSSSSFYQMGHHLSWYAPRNFGYCSSTLVMVNLVLLYFTVYTLLLSTTSHFSSVNTRSGGYCGSKISKSVSNFQKHSLIS